MKRKSVATLRRIDTVPPHHLSEVEEEFFTTETQRTPRKHKAMVLVFLCVLRASVVIILLTFTR